MELVICHLQKYFEDKKVLEDIDFRFEKGKIYGLLGRNGAGKTTLFNCLNQDISVDQGEFYIEDHGKRKVDLKDIGYVVSSPTVPEFLTAREFLQFFIDINQKDIQDLKTVDEYFDFMGILEEDRDRLLKDFSHGMKNKMQMLINFIYNPLILLLDEPLTSLDVVVADEMKKLLKQIKTDHILIFSTHIMELAVELCDEIVLLNHGVLSIVSKDELSDDEFQEKIIHMLKDEDYENND
ncbi:MAG: ATP-binding cassette domain-containing protein [Longibaculum sp.]